MIFSHHTVIGTRGHSKPLKPTSQTTLFDDLININFHDLSDISSDSDGFSQDLMAKVSNSIDLF